MPDRAPQPVDRQLPTQEARDLFALVREMAQREIVPHAAEEEDGGRFPRELFALLSESGLLGLPYDPEFGGGDQPYEVYLQVLEELAAAVNLSPFHFARVFRRATGLPPHAWLQQRRLEQARALLRDGCAPLRVALQLGFADQSHMTRHFKRTYGLSPGRWREMQVHASLTSAGSSRSTRSRPP